MVVQFVFGDLLETRLNQLITARQGQKKIKIVSQHVHNARINNVSLRVKLEQLIRNQVKVTIIVNRRVLAHDSKEQDFLDDLEDNLGIRVFAKRGVHAKMVLLEGTSMGLLVSSLNITNTAIHKNKEAGIFVENDDNSLITDAHDYIATILGAD